jgi:thioredoxin reductase
MTTTEDTTWDAVVIGGGAAGLSAALALGRARRTTLVIDAGRQSNLSAHGIGGLLGRDGRPPAELYADGRRELARYPAVRIADTQAEAVTGELEAGFLIRLADGDEHRARRVLLAGGMDYRYPAVPGADARWGSAVFHCPFCHGWEVAGRPLAVLNPDPAGVHQAQLLTAWSDQVTLLVGGIAGASGALELSAGDRDRLDGAGVTIEPRAVVALHGPGADLERIALADASSLPCHGLLIGTTLHQRTDLAARLGVAFAPASPMTAEAIEIDAQHHTSLPGVYAAGDVTAGPPSVPRAVAQGAFAGAMIVGSLTGVM